MITFDKFLKVFGENTTNNIQLLNWGKKLKIPKLKVIMKDELKKIDKNLKPINIIINLENSDEIGSHWGCIKDDYYFDSYYLPATKEILSFNKNLYYYRDLESPFQEKGKAYCGQVCLFVLFLLNHGFHYEEVLLKLLDYKNGKLRRL